MGGKCQNTAGLIKTVNRAEVRLKQRWLQSVLRDVHGWAEHRFGETATERKTQFEACTRSQGSEWSCDEASEQSLSQGAAKMQPWRFRGWKNVCVSLLLIGLVVSWVGLEWVEFPWSETLTLANKRLGWNKLIFFSQKSSELTCQTQGLNLPRCLTSPWKVYVCLKVCAALMCAHIYFFPCIYDVGNLNKRYLIQGHILDLYVKGWLHPNDDVSLVYGAWDLRFWIKRSTICPLISSTDSKETLYLQCFLCFYKYRKRLRENAWK